MVTVKPKIVKPKTKTLIVTKNEDNTLKTKLKKISPYKKDNTYRYLKNAAIATTAIAATAGLYKLYQNAQKDKQQVIQVANAAKKMAEEAANRAKIAEQERLQAESIKKIADEAAETKRLADEAAETKRLADEAAETKRLADEAEKQRIADEAEKQRLADEAAAKKQRIADEAEKQRIADEAEKQRIADEAEKQRIAEEAERLRKENLAAIEKAKDEDEAAKKIAEEADKVRVEAARIRELAAEKAAQIKLQADAAEKRIKEALATRQAIEKAATEKLAADKIQAAKQREQYLEAERIAKERKIEQEKSRAAARSTELNNLYAEFAKMGFFVPESESNNVYENFIKFSQHREKSCTVEDGKCPDCTAASRFQMCLAKELNAKKVDFNKIIKIMREFHYNVSELGVGINGLQFRKDISTRNLHLNYPTKENAKLR